ncbi:MAG: sigma-E processing peptidase SpoIIGA [Oscillospiraceae bacterium]|nr:sigma-E processing peptidase SpoIIGA [Oscillospiraceae bacterium]
MGVDAAVIYIDVLICVNLIVNYFLLLASCFFTGDARRRGRIALAALAGAFFSLAIALPELSAPASLAIKLLGCCLMALIAFGFGGLRRLALRVFYIFAASALFAGLVFAAGQTALGEVLALKNFSFYADIEPLALAGLVALFYLLLCLAELVWGRPRRRARLLKAEICIGEKSLKFTALPDSGNRLRDPLTGRQAVVLRRSLAPKLLSDEALAALGEYERGGPGLERLRSCGGAVLLPFSTIKEKGLLLSFPASRCLVREGPKTYSESGLLAAFAEDALLGEAEGIVNADIMEEVYCLAEKNSKGARKARSKDSGQFGNILYQRPGNAAAADNEGGGEAGL